MKNNSKNDSLSSLFIELIQVSIGERESLSRVPTSSEWEDLLKLFRKQTLSGICSNGVQKLYLQSPQMLFNLSSELTRHLLVISSALLNRNELLNQRCVELQKALSESGFSSCILKGQGNIRYYPEECKMLRSCGDIDAWLWCPGTLSQRRRKIVDWARKISPDAKAFYHHIDCRIFKDVEVELHYVPSWFNSPFSNRRFVRWCESNAEVQMHNRVGDITAPTTAFNCVYQLAHIYQHIFQEGIGLRQMMDYLFIIKALPKGDYAKVVSDVHNLGMDTLACGVMWVLEEVFALSLDEMPFVPDEKEGRFLLDEIEQAGNFGKYDRRNRRSKSLLTTFIRHTKRNMRFVAHYSSEALWSPIFKIWHWAWRNIYLR